MKLSEFSKEIQELAEKQNILIQNNEIEKLYKYMLLLQEWNEKINLTAITEPHEIILKHFIDSLTINKYIPNNAKIIDVGTGAGFPGIPLGILRKDSNMLLMDSLNKRIKFLDEVIRIDQIENIKTMHARAEDLAQNKNYRENFDVATSRAVASLNVLLEYMLPFVSIGGICICMKGSTIAEELDKARKVLDLLGGTIEKVETFQLACTDNCRNTIVIRKVKNTPNNYPRRAGIPLKDPII